MGLVLSRKCNEEVVLFIGGKPVATVQVVEVGRSKVRLRFAAGEDVVILRGELVDEHERPAGSDEAA